MTFSIIVINYRTPELSADCLRSLLALPDSGDREIIIVDNASGDGSADLLKREFGASLKMIEAGNNLGFSGANNLGARSASGTILLFLNSDTVIKQDIFSRLARRFEDDANLGAISPLLLTAEGKEQEAAYGYFPSLGRLLSRRLTPKIKPDKDGLIRPDWISGCAMAVRKDAFKRIGGFDENFFLYYEDIDLCKRISRAGYGVAVDTEINITHLGGKSLSLNNERKNYYYSSQDYYFWKHFGALTMRVMKLMRAPLRLVKGNC